MLLARVKQSIEIVTLVVCYRILGHNVDAISKGQAVQKIAEERRKSQLHRVGRLKSRID